LISASVNEANAAKNTVKVEQYTLKVNGVTPEMGTLPGGVCRGNPSIGGVTWLFSKTDGTFALCYLPKGGKLPLKCIQADPGCPMGAECTPETIATECSEIVFQPVLNGNG
jgi:hypothetical protein